MTDYLQALAGVGDAPDWTPWGAPRRAERGVETAQHHALVLVREAGGEPRAARPADVPERDGLEWSPMVWALRGRRLWRSVGGLGPGKVFGAGERMFVMGDAACEQAFEGAGLGAKGLEAWIDALQRRISWCEARGIVYRHLVIPENAALKRETLPGAPPLSPDRPLQQILRHGGEAIRERFVYPLEAMRAGAAKAEICYPHDVHFSGWGCFLCYRELMANMPGVDPGSLVREDQLTVRDIFVGGDLARSVGAPGRRVETHEPPASRYKALIKGASYRRNQVDVFQSDATHLPRLALFRTSNSTPLMVYLMRHFSRIAAVATTDLLYDMVESERPDVVLAEMPERYFAMYQPSVDETTRATPPSDPADAFEALTGHRLPLPRE